MVILEAVSKHPRKDLKPGSTSESDGFNHLFPGAPDVDP